jgi:hypothetical protein
LRKFYIFTNIINSVEAANVCWGFFPLGFMRDVSSLFKNWITLSAFVDWNVFVKKVQGCMVDIPKYLGSFNSNYVLFRNVEIFK